MQSLGARLERLAREGSYGGHEGNGPESDQIPLTLSQDWIGAAPDLRTSKLRFRRRLSARWWRGASGLFMCAAVVYGLVAGGHVQTLMSEVVAGTTTAATRAGFTLQELTIEGSTHTSRDAIMQALGFGLGASMLTIDAEAAQARLEKLPWVRHAQVMRLLPSAVHVAVEERTPFAVWQLDGKLHVIALDGTVLGPADDQSRAKLPFVVGAGAATKAAGLLSILAAYPELSSRLHAAVRVADRRWSLELADGVEIRLPEDNIDYALDKLASLEKAHGFLSTDVVAIDLRLSDRVSLRLTDAAAARWAEAQKRAGLGREKTGRDT